MKLMRQEETAAWRRITVGFLVCAAIVLLVFDAEANSTLHRYEVMAANEELVLYVNSATAEIAIQVKASGDLWFSNPDARGRKAQIEIQYYNPMHELRNLNTHDHSIVLGQHSITSLEQGVRVDYTLGREWKDRDRLPTMICVERLESEILQHLSDRDGQFVKSQFRQIMLTRVDKDYTPVRVFDAGPETLHDGSLRELRTELDMAALFRDYTLISPGTELTSAEKRSLVTDLLDSIVHNRTDIDRRSRVTHDDIAHLVNAPTYLLQLPISPWDLSDFLTLLADVGYNPLSIAIDHEANRLDPPIPNHEIFRIPVEYVLEGDALAVTIPMSDVYYPKDVQLQSGEGSFPGIPDFLQSAVTAVFDRVGQDRLSYPLHRIRLLPYFGAAGIRDTGYIFVPDGSGALIDFNCEKTQGLIYHRPMFGADQTHIGLRQAAEGERWIQQNHLPVFGLLKDKQAFLGIVESGQTLAAIRAQTSSQGNPFNTVAPDFTVMPTAQIQLAEGTGYGGGQSLYIYPDEIYQDKLRVRYYFLTGREASYVGMARKYRSYLVDTYNLTLVEPGQAVPFYLDLIGAVQDTRLTMGFARLTGVSLTTYEQAKIIVQELLTGGITNLHLRFSGWLAGGLYHQYPTRIRFEPAVGRRDDFYVFRDVMAQQGVSLFPQINVLIGLQNLRHTSLSVQRDVAQAVNARPVMGSTAWGEGFLLAPARLPEYVERFLQEYSRLELPQLALMEMGRQLHSDFRQDQGAVTREEAMAIVVEQLAVMREQGLELMITGGNSYALPYTAHVVEMPLDFSGFNITAESVPFFQIAIHGYVNYAGIALNEAAEYKHAVLRSLEVGAYPMFRWMHADAYELKHSASNYLFANHYRDWLQIALDVYTEVNDVLQPLQNVPIADHEYLAAGVYRTTYENGTAIIVNYNRQPITVKDHTIPEESFAVITEAGITHKEVD